MQTYTKVIGLTGSHFVKEFVKIRHHDNKVREISEETVAKSLKKAIPRSLSILKKMAAKLSWMISAILI
jgi:hypothetical protein